MDLRELYYLNALAEEQSISKAAERLYIAQASLSQFLRQFEAQLGSPIFVRTNKGIRPTPSGKVFLSHAKHILKEYQQAQQEFWDNENTVGGTVFFGVSSFRSIRIGFRTRNCQSSRLQFHVRSIGSGNRSATFLSLVRQTDFHQNQFLTQLRPKCSH